MADVLSSDILEQQFGPTEIEVLYQDDQTRIIATKVVDSKQVLEVSWVKFIPAGVKKFSKTHQTVMAGESMGKAFRASDIGFARQEKAAYSYILPANFKRIFGDDKAATIVEVVILAGSNKTPYAEILETYSPAVHWPHLHGQPTDGQPDLSVFV